MILDSFWSVLSLREMRDLCA